MKTLEWNDENSPNRNLCQCCGQHIESFERLCKECKRITHIGNLAGIIYPQKESE